MKKNLRRLGFGVMGLLFGTLTSSAITFTNDAVISISNTNYEGQELVVSNCTLTIDGTHTFANLHIMDGGVVRHSSAPDGMLQEIITIHDEQHSFNETNMVRLLGSNVTIDSIVVTDVSGEVFYTNNVDYYISVGSSPEIMRLVDSSIPEGGTISVDYEHLGILAEAGMFLTITNNLEIENGGAIDLSGAGFGGGFGPGSGLSRATNNPYVYTNGAGGGHGGYGGISISAALGGTIYGSVTNPVTLGSGGGLGESHGGSGGGVGRIEIGNMLRMDGRITADGGRGTNAHSGGGAGGSLWISAKAFSGYGVISANGGSGELYNGGGGGGGRIAVYYDESSYTGDIVAQGGIGWVAGGAGTVYTKATDSLALLILDNRGLAGTNTSYTFPTTDPLYDLVVKGGTILDATNLDVRHLIVSTNSWIIAPPVFSLIINVNGSAEIHTKGGLSADLRGSSPGTGSGGGQTGPAGAGASHGGNGGLGNYNGIVRATYGSLMTPVAPGSGGGSSIGGAGGPGGYGGGVIKMSILGPLILDGEISADGGRGLGVSSGGGSGGSILLSANSISGSGRVSADGGAGYLPQGGGGGGGRIAFYYTTNLFAGKFSAYGGEGWQNGGAGTVYFKASNKLIPDVFVDNGGRVGNTLLGANGGDLTISGGAVVSNLTSGSFNNLLIHSNSWYRPGNNSLLTISSNLVIHASGGISADGQGSFGSTGLGQTSFAIGGGGGHGGYGGMGGTNSLGGVSFGSLTMPQSSGGHGGSGGGASTPYTFGGAGGGVLRITVGKDLVLDGKISAEGMQGPGSNSGGGAGGSIYLTVGRLEGSGVISANGGEGEMPLGGGGGGGRIAIYYSSKPTNEFAGKITAFGGAGFNFGGAGTIYLKSNDNSVGQIIAENAGNSGGYTSFQPSGSDDLTIGSGANVVMQSSQTSCRNLLVESNGLLTLVTNGGSSLTFNVSGNATIEHGASVKMDGRNTVSSQGAGGCMSSSVYGNSGGGGGNGGYGGASISGAAGGIPLTSISQPTTPGGLGGSCAGSGGAGGGSIRFFVNSNLTVNGTLSVDGMAGLTPGSGGGAGGSLYLTVGKLFGSGMISAIGGAGESPYGGGGGGGRIAIHYTTNQFTGDIQAHGGTGAKHGGAGTIYLKANSSQIPQVIIANNGILGALTSYPGTGSHNLTVSQGAFVSVVSGTYLFNNLLIRSNSWLTVSDNQSATLSLNGTATIEKHAGINLQSKGYIPGSLIGSTGSGGGGAGHGGDGGGAGGSSIGGKTYGSIAAPSQMGSGASTIPGPGARGGGALRLNWPGKTLHLDGEINVNGGNALTNNAGGASGGSIWLTIGRLTGTGTISANGGSGMGNNGCGGGGGRIAIHYSTNNFAGTLSAYGGSGWSAGGAGTIYLKSNAGTGELRVDNGGLAGATTPLTGWTETGRLTVSGGAAVLGNHPTQSLKSLAIATNSTFRMTNLFGIFAVTEYAVVDGSIVLDGIGNFDGFGSENGEFTGSGGGGGHGGAGGVSGSGAAGGAIHGSETSPFSSGGQGGLPFSSSLYSRGGGAIQLQVGGNLTVNGGITANGSDAILDRSGGGAGGSIWITTHTLFGNGVISADGGVGEPVEGGGGGGGRIAIYSRSNAFNGILSVAGGIGWQNGGDGTLFLAPIAAPYVIFHSVPATLSSAVDNVRFTFNDFLNMGSVSASDFVIQTPNGPILPTSVSFVGSSAVQVNFPTQNTLGNYSVTVGPQIQSVYGLSMTSNYVANFTITPVTISGTVTDTNGVALPGVTLESSDGLPTMVTDTNGFYSLSVIPGWNGSVTPSEAGYIFVSPIRHYTNLTVNATNQDFVRIAPESLSMSSSSTGTDLHLGIHGINGVTYQAYSSTNLVIWFPYGAPILGTNGPVALSLSVTNAPHTFFQFRLSKQ